MLTFCDAAPGGGVENAGVSRAITEMLLGSGLLVPTVRGDGSAGCSQWVTRLFPVWPANISASFSGLISKGGVAASASYNASTQTIVSPIILAAPFAGASGVVNATLRMPWPLAPISSVLVSCGGVSTPVTWITDSDGTSEVPALSFIVPRGATCGVELSGT